MRTLNSIKLKTRLPLLIFFYDRDYFRTDVWICPNPLSGSFMQFRLSLICLIYILHSLSLHLVYALL